jgi:hypothetical protein
MRYLRDALPFRPIDRKMVPATLLLTAIGASVFTVLTAREGPAPGLALLAVWLGYMTVPALFIYSLVFAFRYGSEGQPLLRAFAGYAQIVAVIAAFFWTVFMIGQDRSGLDWKLWILSSAFAAASIVIPSLLLQLLARAWRASATFRAKLTAASAGGTSTAASGR